MAKLNKGRIAKGVVEAWPGAKCVWSEDGGTLFVSTRAWTKVLTLAMEMPDLTEDELIDNIVTALGEEQPF